MNIDRSNYEIWLIDWLDGNLSDIRVEQLKLFLKENPDIKEEFEGLKSIGLKPDLTSLPNRNHLKKSFEDLTQPQFEYLCVAYLENDLTAGQRSELEEMVGNDPEKKSSFELIQKMVLSSPDISYNRKNRLLKRTPLQITMRLSIISLSTAAAIAILIISFFSTPRSLPDKINNTAFEIFADSSHSMPETDKPTERKQPDIRSVAGSKRTARLPVVKAIVPVIADNYQKNVSENDSVPVIPGNRELLPEKITYSAKIEIAEGLTHGMLAGSNAVFIVPPEDERSNIGRFLAKNFRSKILKDKTEKDSPLKGYELAEAGVIGLNKLLGWEMALEKNNDENGELKSVYFSSKILKFNAPVKKSEKEP
jgi:hypothetical protein